MIASPPALHRQLLILSYSISPHADIYCPISTSMFIYPHLASRAQPLRFAMMFYDANVKVQSPPWGRSCEGEGAARERELRRRTSCEGERATREKGPPHWCSVLVTCSRSGGRICID